MKKFLVCFILCNIVVLGSQAQVTKKYYEYSSNVYYRDFVKCSEGGYLILASSLILRVDQDGEFLWEKSINFFGTKVQETEGGYYIAGSIDNIGYLMKINKQGDSLWSRKYVDYEYAIIRYIKQLSNFDLILSLSQHFPGSGFPDYNLIRTDSLGNIIWNQYTVQVQTSEIVELDNNDIVVLGSDFRENQPPQFPESCWPSKIKYNSGGTMTSYLGFTEMDWAECTATVYDGENYYFATDNENYSIFQLENSTVEWTRNYGNFNYYSICTDTNMLYLTGAFGNYNWSRMIILSITKSGDSVSIFKDSEDYVHVGEKIIIDNDNLVVLGQVRKSQNSNYCLCLTKMPISYILTGTTEKLKNDHHQFYIFPNPATNTIYFNDFYPGKQKRVNVYNISGKLELSEKYLHNFIDVSGLNNGLYIIEIFSEGEKLVAKFIKK
ncbi:MAG: T9SS type A sorting domain-containing protein [Candidatus Shapirobacteria bacterium]